MNEQDDKPLYTVEVTSADLTVEVYSFEAMLDILEQNTSNITLHVSNTLPKSNDEVHTFSEMKIDFCDQEEEEVMLHGGYSGTPAIYFDARHSVFLKADNKFKILTFVREEQEDFRQYYRQAIEFRV
jgi:hypothetical protein